MALYGPPDRVRERIAMLKREVNLNYLMCWMTMAASTTEGDDPMERFAGEVMPHFADPCT